LAASTDFRAGLSRLSLTGRTFGFLGGATFGLGFALSFALAGYRHQHLALARGGLIRFPYLRRLRGAVGLSPTGKGLGKDAGNRHSDKEKFRNDLKRPKSRDLSEQTLKTLGRFGDFQAEYVLSPTLSGCSSRCFE
jgi:hypothetical protein